MIDQETREILQRQHYSIVGRHSAVKLCHWLKKSLLDEGFCYKEKFYGIKSHRCLQMTPAVSWCTQRCVFCWRNIEHTLGIELRECDQAEEIIDKAIKAQRRLLSGYGGIPDRINQEKFKEAQNPNQAAISLAGEPTIYPRMDELLEEFHRRDFTTFLVTNGTFPERLEALDVLPTQLYLSLEAPDKELHSKICNPIIPDAWERINKSLELLNSLDTKTAIRLTLIRDLNYLDPGRFSSLLKNAEPEFIEVKSYMHVGSSRKRLAEENMLHFPEIMEFSQRLAEEIGYTIKDWQEVSRVVLLSKKY